MIIIPIYQVDAFAHRLFTGNPAAVCLLPRWLADGVLQNIAAENNQAETAFVVSTGGRHEIRWFTPAVEVDLCGHATLAAAHVLFSRGVAGNRLEFESRRSGLLVVSRDGSELVLDFPPDTLTVATPPKALVEGLGLAPLEVYRGKTDYLLVYGRQSDVEGMRPDFALVASVPCRGVIVTAPGSQVDFVSRFFAPQSGIPEDPVTGSAHTTLTPFWAARLGKVELSALQLSRRGGRLRCRLEGGRVHIAGHVQPYMSGQLELDVEAPSR